MNTVQGFHFDTLCSITAEADEALLNEALNLCLGYEQLLSAYVEGSDVWRLNHAQGSPVEVSGETLEILRCAQAVSEASQGAFNIFVGAATKLWKFTGDDPVIPSDEELDNAAKLLGNFCLSFEDRLITIPASAQIDLGGVAKGYICDKIADALGAMGVENALLNFGGNITTRGVHPKGRPWNIGLQKPSAARNEAVFAAVECSNAAVVTSGVYERSFIHDDVLYHHILDPRTCHPATTDLVSVSVVSKCGMLADALATAILVLGAEQGTALAHSFNAQIALLTSDDKLTYTQGMPLVVIH